MPRKGHRRGYRQGRQLLISKSFAVSLHNRFSNCTDSGQGLVSAGRRKNKNKQLRNILGFTTKIYPDLFRSQAAFPVLSPLSGGVFTLRHRSHCRDDTGFPQTKTKTPPASACLSSRLPRFLSCSAAPQQRLTAPRTAAAPAPGEHRPPARPACGRCAVSLTARSRVPCGFKPPLWAEGTRYVPAAAAVPASGTDESSLRRAPPPPAGGRWQWGWWAR